ncbi:RagB/SusD family nutrient uptake outer membrane protein [Marinifilum sp.]|uniref:RagB/SusD family nutrient uptake outer membrane protein n=1 Tax=Marinifilum sp. TaxID=2033137 RepID=UPI003BAB189D
MKNILLLIMIGIAAVSCDSFLDEPIEKSSAKSLETAEELDAVIEGLPFLYPSETDFFCTDNFTIPIDFYSDLPTSFDINMEQQYVMTPFTENSGDIIWNLHYETIWTCNLAIKSINEGELKGDKVLLSKLKAEAHFIRAMSYFSLVLNYCLHPSTQNENELGLPLRTNTDGEENLTRSGLKETYEFIESDLAEALKADIEFTRNWRISTVAVKAFAARYYLYVGQFDLASVYADEALTEYSDMIDYATEFPTVEMFDAEYPISFEYSQNRNDSRSLAFWKGQYYNRFKANFRENTIPSQELIDLFNPLDKRYELFMVEGYFKRFGGSGDLPLGYVQGAGGACISGPSTAEMYLIRAEAKARNNDIAGAAADVEQVRMHRFATADYVAMDVPTDKKSAIEMVIDERRREMPFTSRWYDIRRLNADAETDDIVIRRSFYPVSMGSANTNAELMDYVIEANSRLFARPLASGIINLSNGQTKQNEY